MKAAYIERVGPPEAIRFGELPEPVAGPNDVLVRTEAVAVDPVDAYIRSGRVPMELPKPFIIGRDMVGTVERVGAQAQRYQAGDRVWSNRLGFSGRQGTFAERLAIDQRLLYPVPQGVDAVQLVAFVHSGMTATSGLERVGIKPGETIFIGGGSGNVGSAAIQLARSRGARIFATVGTAEGLAWCRQIGAEEVADYRAADWSERAARFAPAGFDVYWETSGHNDFDRAVALMAPSGRIVLMAGWSERPPLPAGPFYVKNLSLLGFAITYASDAIYDLAAAEINRLAAGNLRVRIDRVLPLSAAAEAHRLVESGERLNGKLVLRP